MRRPGATELNGLRAILTNAHSTLAGPRTFGGPDDHLIPVRGDQGDQDDRCASRPGPALRRGELWQRSLFWHVDLKHSSLETTLRATITPSDLIAAIERADRCRLIVDLIDAVAARAPSGLSCQLVSRIRRIETPVPVRCAASRGARCPVLADREGVSEWTS